jgi:hypothetical protein
VRGTAEHHAGLFQGAPDRFIRDPKRRALGQVIDQPLERPEGVGEPSTPGPPAHGSKPCRPIGLGHVGGAARARRLVHTVEAFREVAGEPTPHRRLARADDGGHLGHLEPRFCGKEDHRRAGAPPRIFGGARQGLEFRVLSRGQRWDMDCKPSGGKNVR